MKRIHIPETASYRRAFDAVNAMMDVQHMTNGVEAPSVDLGVPGDQGLVIVAVGPPARGKSATYNAAASVLGVPVQLFNAGDVRRVWEQEVRKKYGGRAGGGEVLVRRLVAKKLVQPGGNVRAADLEAWLNSPDGGAIPGHIFKYFAPLNERFARVCYTSAVAQACRAKAGRRPRVTFFDATNTDRQRRLDVLQAFLRANQGHNTRLLFVENICLSARQLKTNFWSKMTTSGDYKPAVLRACNGKAPPKDNTLTLFDYQDPRRLDEANPCKAAIVRSMADITTRDKGYLRKYVPMHVNEGRGAPSTVDTIARINRDTAPAQIAYLQVIVPQCLPDDSPRGTPRRALYRTNLDLRRPGAKRLLARLTSIPRARASSYDQEHRWQPGAADVADLL